MAISTYQSKNQKVGNTCNYNGPDLVQVFIYDNGMLNYKW